MRKALPAEGVRYNWQRMKFSLFGIYSVVAAALVLSARAESPGYLVFVSNERSGDITVIDGATDAVVTTFKAGKRPRGIHATPDGKRLFVTLSGSPRMAPGVDENRSDQILSNSRLAKMENSPLSRMKTMPALRLLISTPANLVGK